jgi:histidinol-phosphate phosphatase family protein
MLVSGPRVRLFGPRLLAWGYLGTCRDLVEDCMGMTSAHWRLDVAEAISNPVPARYRRIRHYRQVSQLPLRCSYAHNVERPHARRTGALDRDDSGEAKLNASVLGWGQSAPLASNPRSRAGILLDRDGTIIVDHGYVGSVERVEFIEGSVEAIAKFNQAGVPVAVVTNQAGVARGFYGIEDVAQVHHYIAEHLAEYGAYIDLFLYCPYHPAGVIEAFTCASEDRKPRPGMARAAEAALNLDLTVSWVLGDRPEDIGLAKAVGAAAVYLGTDGYQWPGVWSFPSLAAAAPFILERILT